MGRPIPAGIMPDFREMLPELLKENYGKWAWHESLAPGVYRHLTAEGAECISVRVQLPPNGILSTGTLRLFSRWIREYALAGRRTSRQSFELVGVVPARLQELLEEVRGHGFVVGGTGNSLHQLKGCSGYVHCQNGAIDSPSVMKCLGDALYDDLVACCYPAPLKISVSGCPNQCGAGIEGDIGILGIYLDFPEVDDERLAESSPDFGLLSRWCPGGAIKLKSLPQGKSITITQDRCTRCSSCAMVAPEGITMGPRRGAAIAVGGRGPSGDRAPRLARVAFPYLPARPPAYAEILEKVRVVIDTWVSNARAGERIAEYIDRVGWETFLAEIGAGSEVPTSSLMKTRCGEGCVDGAAGAGGL